MMVFIEANHRVRVHSLLIIVLYIYIYIKTARVESQSAFHCTIDMMFSVFSKSWDLYYN